MVDTFQKGPCTRKLVYCLSQKRRGRSKEKPSYRRKDAGKGIVIPSDHGQSSSIMQPKNSFEPLKGCEIGVEGSGECLEEKEERPSTLELP